MSPVPQTGHEHHGHIREHIDRLPELADLLERRPLPVGFARRFAVEYDFLTGTLWPHVEVVERSVYPELERLGQNHHSIAHLRREHVQLSELIESIGDFMERVDAVTLQAADAMALRRLVLQLYALVKTHLGEEEEYLRALGVDLSPDQRVAERDMEHALVE